MVASKNLKTTGLRSLAPEIADVWRIAERPELVDWAERSARMPATISAFPGPVDLRRRFPYTVGILAACDDPETEDVTIMASSQIGKTIAMVLAMLGLSHVSPSPAMFVAPDKDAMEELADRVYAIADESPELAAIVPPEHRRNNLYVDLGKSRIHLAFSGNKQRLSSKSCRRVFMTEVDRYDSKKSSEGDTMALAAERVKMFARRLIVRESTPTIKGKSRIADAYYDQSDRRTFRVPCPHCGEYQRLQFWPDRDTGLGGIQGLRDKASGEYVAPERALKEAWYQCCKCGKRISDEEKGGAIRRGVWCPEGRRVARDGSLEGEPLRPKRHAGFHLSTLYAPPEAITFGQVAAKYLESRGDRKAYQSFRNNWLGLTYEPNAEAVPWQELRGKLTIPLAREVVHPEAIFLTLGADVQAREVFWALRAWWVRGEDGACQPTSCLVGCGVLKPTAGDDGQEKRNSDLDQLDALVARRWAKPDGSTVGVRLACVDTGHRTADLYRWLRARAAARFRGVKGDNRAAATGWTRTIVDKDATSGKTADRGLELWLLATNAYTEDVQARWGLGPDEPGAWLANESATELYFRQLTNAAFVDRPRADGTIARQVVIRDHGLRCDFLDCEVYALAAAEMVVGQDWAALPAMAAAARAAEVAAAHAQAAPKRPREKTAPRHVREREGGWTRRG